MSRIRVAILEADPIFASGLRAALSADEAFQVVWTATDQEAAMNFLRGTPCDLLLASPMAGLNRTLEMLVAVRARSADTRVLLWDVVMSEVAKRQMERSASARWVNRKVSPEHLRAVLKMEYEAGPTESGLYCESESAARRLTVREKEIVQHVRLGMKNREIAEAMGITAGTVKVHLMHIFEKTGLRDRIQLAQYASQLLDSPVPSRAAAGMLGVNA